MENLDFRKQNADTIDEHVLTADELKQLIENKFKRAYAYQTALGKREERFVEFD